MVGKTERTLKRNVLNPMAKALGSDFDYSQGAGEIKIFDRLIYVVGANDERSSDKIRGSTIAGSYGDEITLWPESFFTMLLSRLSVTGSKFFGTTNPDSPYHYLKKKFIDRKNELDLEVFHFELDDNITLDPAYVAALKLEYTGLFYKRFILGLWVAAEGAIYDMWDEDIHVFKGKIPTNYDHYTVSVDYGTSNPCVFGLFGHYNNGRADLIKEYWHDSKKKRQKTDGDYADDLEKFIDGYKLRMIYSDPSAASFIAELRKRRHKVQLANNDVLNGIRCVSSRLSSLLFRVHESCTNSIKEFSGYVWDDKASKKGEDKPVKENDHAMDMIRYFLYTCFGRSRIIGGAKVL